MGRKEGERESESMFVFADADAWYGAIIHTFKSTKKKTHDLRKLHDFVFPVDVLFCMASDSPSKLFALYSMLDEFHSNQPTIFSLDFNKIALFNCRKCQTIKMHGNWCWFVAGFGSFFLSWSGGGGRVVKWHANSLVFIDGIHFDIF